MERILRFKQISEKYSLNNSVELLSKEVIDFILDKFDSWIMRKSLANYSEIHKYKPSFKSSDFPVVLFKIKTVFVVESGPAMSKSGHLNSSGRAYYDFGSNRHKMSPVIRKNGDIVSSIEIKIYVPFNKRIKKK